MKDTKAGRYATAAIIFGGIIGTYFFSSRRQKGFKTKLSIKRQRKVDQNLVTPANATFGIVWGTIYAGTIALAVHQAMPSQLQNPRYRRAQTWLRLNYILSIVFGYFFSKSDKKSRIGAAITTVSMLPAAIGLHKSLEIGSTEVDVPESILQKSVSLYTGWLTAASAVSITTLTQEFGYAKKGESAVKWALAALPVTSLAGLWTSKQLNDPYYLITIVAALAGIAIKQKNKNPEISILASTLGASLIGVVADKLYLRSDNIREVFV